MVEFTFFEFHLNDPQLTANAPFSGRDKDVAASDESPGEAGRSAKGSAIAAVIGLVFLVVVAVVVKKKVLAGDDVEVEETIEAGGVEAPA